MQNKKSGLLSVFILLAIVTQVVACKGLFNTKLFKERAAETPIPSEEHIDKTFFVNADGSPKSFLCAWAPEMGQGFWGEREFLHLVNDTPHCNLEFEIRETALIGRRIHPSYPNDRSRWPEIVRIPILKQFYYEREKDQHGRETNKWIENDTRSHWSARPKIKLNLSAVSVPGLGAGFTIKIDGKEVPVGPQTAGAEEIEWDHQKTFLGFTLQMKLWGEHFQAKIRFNFLEYKHDPTFKKTPYHQENAQYMNILHVMSRRIEGIEPELYAAHWDLRHTNTIYLNGVPKEHEKTIMDAIEKWNQSFRAIGAIGPKDKAFEGKVMNLKHPFDLRYPSFNWISDVRISQFSPLGIGMAHADVRNGKILWGSVNLYGGMLEHYIARYTPVAYGSADAKGSDSQLSDALNPIRTISDLFTRNPAPIKRLEEMTMAARPALANNLVVDRLGNLPEEIENLMKLNTPRSRAEADAKRDQLNTFNRRDPKINSIVADLTDQSQKQLGHIDDYFKRNNMLEHYGSSLLNKVASLQKANAQAVLAGRPDMAAIAGEKDPAKRASMIRGAMKQGSSFQVEEGMTVANMIGGWSSAAASQNRSFPEMLESVVMDLTLHELGHFMGLGHQFKENIVPEKGTVPTKYVDALAAKATKEAGFTNYTSVMGYRHGKTEMLTTTEEMAPGPHDELVLRYLYLGKYAAYDPIKDDFIFGQVPASGKIPSVSQIAGHSETYKVAYFPSCNDFEASLGADPFCNRWDRGSSAQEIVKSYFESINDNLLTNLYSLVGGGSNPEWSEAILWHSALETMSRTRLFYDEMRRRLRSEPDLKPLWNQLRQDKAALLEFAQACEAEHSQIRAPVLQKIFARADMRDLCRANLIAMNEYRFYLNLPNSDYTRIDHKGAYIAGGYLEGDASRNYGNIFGSWYALSNLPLKISALYTLTTSRPFHLWWGAWLGPNLYYDHEENRFLYRTLYPRKYTQLIADSVQHNMRFEATGHSDTTGIGRSILAAGSMLPWMRHTSNDAARLPEDYNTLLNQQTEFQYSMVAVLIKPTKPDANSNVKADHYKKFTATIYDFFTGRSTGTRDVYLLPNGSVLVWANGAFIYPVTEMKFYSGNEAYVIAYKISYGYKPGDELVEDSVKAKLLEKHDDIMRRCVEGFNNTNGLNTYFETGSTEFEGFLIPPGIAEEAGTEKMDLFHKSVDKAFEKFDLRNANEKDRKIPDGFPIKSMRQVCEKVVRGVGQISASAALINGFWLGITSDYLEK
jgi:hypothetical protein